VWIGGKVNANYAWLCFREEVFTESTWKGSEEIAEAFVKNRDWDFIHKVSLRFPRDVHTFLTTISATKKVFGASKERSSAERYPQ